MNPMPVTYVFKRFVFLTIGLFAVSLLIPQHARAQLVLAGSATGAEPQTGAGATATGTNAVAGGPSASASGTNAVAIGLSSAASGTSATAIGSNVVASADFSTAI